MNRGSKLLTMVLLAATLAGYVSTRADDVEDEYYARSRSLGKNDVRGHLTLAVWCKERERWELVARECHTVKGIEPNNAKANLLLELARAHLEQQHRPPGSPPNVRGDARVKPDGRPRVLTDAEVQRIRRAELRSDDKARIRIDRKTLKAFYDAMRSAPDFDYDRKSFFRLPPIEKARLLLARGEERYAQGVTVVTDPQRMRVFNREVMPLVAKNCATVECHGGGGASAFQIYGGRVRDNVAYTNFLIMHEYRVGEQELLNRNAPENSLILTYGLPPQPGDAGRNHPTPIEPVYRNTSDRDYQTILAWLESLALERPDYGIDLKAPAHP